MIADLFFILGSSFILGVVTKAYFSFWILINFFLSFLFYFKNKNLKISFLILLFLFLGSLFYDLAEEKELNLPSSQLVTDYRYFLEEKIKNYLPFPQENLLRGILFGAEFEDKEIKENFAKSGLLHLTAVSGQNLTIMFSIFYYFLRLIPFFTPNLLFLFSNLVIIFFILLMGFEGSVLRAGIMGFFLLLIKRKFGRLPLRRNILLLTALIFVFLDTHFLLKDIGTQLSFLAMAGILYLAPIFEEKLGFLKFNLFKKTISETLSAQIFTLPLILYYFGNFNLFSLLANILVLPIIPYLMILSFVFLFLPLKVLSWLSLPLLSYVLFVSEIFSQIGFLYFKIPLILIFLIYFFIFLEIYQRLKNETIDFRLNLR